MRALGALLTFRPWRAFGPPWSLRALEVLRAKALDGRGVDDRILAGQRPEAVEERRHLVTADRIAGTVQSRGAALPVVASPGTTPGELSTRATIPVGSRRLR